MTSINKKIRIAVLTSLYPNSAQPRHGVFVEERMRHLAADERVELRVVAPVPWFFSRHARFGRYATFAAVPVRETRYGIDIVHPRYPVIPRIGMSLGALSMAIAAAPALTRLRADGFDFDLLDVHYFYPDGVAGSHLAKLFKRPFVVTGYGTDVNKITTFTLPRRQILRAARKSAALATVSDSLLNRLVSIGVSRRKIITLRSGVDLSRFRPVPQAVARAKLGMQGPVWLCVGHLIERKGMHIAIEALAAVPEASALIVGDGEQESALKALVNRLGVAARVRFIGHVDHDKLGLYYSAADALILPARSEGMPNVVLEALACGTAVIATAVDGIPETVSGPPAGLLMDERTPAAVLRAWSALSRDGLNAGHREARRRFARRFSWRTSIRIQMDMFDRILQGRSRDAAL